MKRDFTPLNHSQGHEQHSPEQMPPSQGWSPAMPAAPINAQANVPPAQPAQSAQPAQPQEKPLSQIPRRPAGSGLLSNWKSAQQGQQVQQGPVTGAGQPYPRTNLQSLMSGPVSPHQSGVSPLPTFYNAPGGNSNGHNSNNQPANPQPLQSLSPNFNMQKAAAVNQPSPRAASQGQQGPQSQNVPPFQSFNQQPQPQQSVQPVNGPSAPPFVVGPGTQQQQNQPFGPQSMPGQPNQFNQSQNHDPWLQRPNGSGNLPPNANRPGGNGGGGKKQSRKKKRRFPIWAGVAVAILAVLMVVIGSGIWYYEANFAGAVNNITGQVAPRVKGDDNPNQGRDSSSSILSGGRVNILLLGSDDDYKSTIINHGVLAQTDIIVSIDPQTHGVTMFSLPRDTWLNVPGFGMHKLDQAYLLGGGGPAGAALTMATIHQDFGVYIDHYAWVGLTGFMKVIDTVGGIDINVIHPITDDTYPDDTGKGALDPYAVKRLDISPGPQHLDGLAALEYVRSRHADLVGDFGRSVRQQQILSQLKYKLDNPSIVGQLPTLANDLNGSIKTDMSLQQVFDMVNFARTVNQSQIQKITLVAPYSSDAQVNTSSGEQDVVELNCSLVQPLIAKTFDLGNNATCNLQANNSSTSQVASIAQPASTANVTAQEPSSNAAQVANNIIQTGALSLTGSWSDFAGIRSLLDILFMATFESFDALTV